MINKFAVIGLGRFGSSVAVNLSEKGSEVLAIDIREDKIEDLRDEVAYAVTLDATDIKTLRSQNIQDMDAVVVAIGSNFESLLLCTVNLMELNIKRIIARAMTPTQRMILERIGVKEIISPEVEVGASVAEKLLNPGIVKFLQLPGDYEIVEIETPPNITKRTIADVNLRKRYNLNLITIKREQRKFDKKEGESVEEIVIGVPGPETVLLETDKLIIMGKSKDLKRFVDVNQ